MLNRCGGAVLALLGGCLVAGEADACGCFAPPVPANAEDAFAVNQQAEQIIFEVQEDTISAHVRIFYQGDPAEFAWLLPMPSVPDLELSNGLLFGLIDQQSAPQFRDETVNICPQQKYYCQTHDPCYEDELDADEGFFADAGLAFDDSESTDEAPGRAPAVEVLARQQIGSYDTITFAADEADAAIDWLNDNGFIVNETMSPYMQPYLDMEMVFIASRLVPGADLDEIRPLRLTYEAQAPSIPLQLTAIAAEPHMTVTAFIYANEEYDPAFLPLTEIPEENLMAQGRNNYPMVLARAVDDAGGNAFVKEYVGRGPEFRENSGCCEDSEDDWCGVGDDGLCQCPQSEFDLEDCAEEEELVEAATMARELSETYDTMTRLTTRVSPDEMTFNPEFEPATDALGSTRLFLTQTDYSLSRCESDIVDQDAYQEVVDSMACGAVYCDYGECVITEQGPACECEDGFAARAFLDSDGATSVTCVPEINTVDFAAGGLELPDACRDSMVADGECVDVGGFPAFVCDDGFAAAWGPEIGGTRDVLCSPVMLRTEGPGASNPSPALQDLDVCAPPPPSCAAGGWLVEREVSIEGVQCADPPDESWFEEPPAPDCSDEEEPTETDTAPASRPDVYLAEDDEGEPVEVEGDDEVDTTRPRPTLIEPEPTKAGGGGGDDGCSVVVAGASSTSGVGWALLAIVGVFELSRRRSAGSRRV